MRIEKINENQIRCTLTEDDLNERNLRITELAYGTEKAKGLFRDMVEQASYEFGFETDNVPLMIEAIPEYPGSLVLLITKVDDPKEVNPSYSVFTDNSANNSANNPKEKPVQKISFDEDTSDSENKTRDIFDGITVTDSKKVFSPDGVYKNPQASNDSAPKDLIRVFKFKKLADVSALAETLRNHYNGQNRLYKNDLSSEYVLVMHKSDHTNSEFNKICNVVSEYGKLVSSSYASDVYYAEHFKVIMKTQALQILASI